MALCSLETISVSAGEAEMANSWGGTRTEQPCGACGSANMMRIDMTFEGSPVSVRVCADCDTRTWTRKGEPVRVERVTPSMRRIRK